MRPEEIEALVSRAEPNMREAWESAIAALAGSQTLDVLEALIRAGRVNEILASAENVAARLGRVSTSTYINTGSEIAEELTRSLARQGRGDVVIEFGVSDPNAIRRIQENDLRLVREITTQQRKSIRAVLVDGVERGLNPRQQAQNIQRSIGLTGDQVRAVANYRRLLERGSLEALTRQLRDRRFDPTVRRAKREGRPLTVEQIDRMVERYREKAIKHRVETIARTESLEAVHAGVNDGIRQGIDSGAFTQNQITRVWNTARDEKVRGSHATMHRQIVRGDNPFVSGLGNQLRYPGDPRAPAGDRVNCRCSVGVELDISLPAFTSEIVTT